VGYRTGSMALLADGWHMATHVGALGLSAAAYVLARRFAGHRAFAFGTGKVHALAGYTSAVTLGLIASVMAVESVSRLLHPATVDFPRSLPVAVLGLVVNVVSVRLLHSDESEEEGFAHGQGSHDHNHRAAMMHVIADTLTSVLAIVALLAGRFLGLEWLDPTAGLLGALVILKWGVDLCRGAAFELLDIEPSSWLEDRIREQLEAIDDVRVADLHVWSLGQGMRSCVVTVITAAPREVGHYRDQLSTLGIAHLTIEVRRCTEGHEVTRALLSHDQRGTLT
jgi:cation diffusion facilitator family transporter